MNKKRLSPKVRRESILIAALDLAKTHGYNRITRDAIAEHAGVSMGLVTRYFHTMQQLRRTLMRAAIKSEILEIVAQGLASNDVYAQNAPDELKERAINSLMR